MTWAEHHALSERYATEAELRTRRGDGAGAKALYRQAALAEARALEALPRDKLKTLGITAVSTAALWFKAGDYEAARQVATEYLAVPTMPTFALAQLRELLQTIDKYQPGFKVGDEVRSIVNSARIGLIKALAARFGSVQYYEVFWADTAGRQVVPETDIRPHQAFGKPTEALIKGVVVGYAEFQRLITFHRISRDRPLRNNIYAFNASRTQFYSFQFKPLVKLLDSPNSRLLICDEVGLGKTIEAGLILLEERARREVRTVLIVCPSGLRAKWKMELDRRFDEQFAILDSITFRDFLDEYESKPDRARVAGIVSLETIRNKETLERIEELSPDLDVVIIDEAHHLRNFGTLSRRAGVAVGGDAGTLVLLTATPVHLGTENLYSLLNILDPRDFPDQETAAERFRQNEPVVKAQRLITGGAANATRVLEQVQRFSSSEWLRGHRLLPRLEETLRTLVTTDDEETELRLVIQAQRDLTELNLLGHIFTRTRKRDVKIKAPVREARAWTVSLNSMEREFYDSMTQLVQEERRLAEGPNVALQWALNTLQRRIASSVQATVEYYRREDPFDDHDLGEDDDEESLPPPEERRADFGPLKARVQALISAWPSNAPDSKYARLADLLRQQRATRSTVKVLVFAFFKETLRYLSRRLAQDGVDHVVISGDVPPRDRDPLIARFRTNHDCFVMLSSRVGSEGLDFQFSDTLVNYDLPWNPMEVEQRIGRLDRIGQAADKILIFNLWTEDTIEERILRVLYDRIGIFESAIGDLDAVIGDVLKELDKLLVAPDLTVEQREAEAARIARVIEAEKQHVEELEQQASAFVGVDAFFDEEIEGIRRGRRYVTGQQLFRFLEDYLRTKAPGTRLRYDHEAKTGVLIPDAALRQLIQKHHTAGELVNLIGAGSEGVSFTMDAPTAFDRPSLEFINVLHPLVEIIRADYDDELRSRVSAQHVTLRTKRLPVGRYIYVIYRLRVDGERRLNFLETVILDERLGVACNREHAEAVAGEMVELGEDPANGTLTLEGGFAARAAKAAEDAFLDRLQVLRRDLELQNAALVDRRVASLRFHIDRQLGRKRELLQKQEIQGRGERVLQMTRGQVKKLEGELARRLLELEQHRRIQVEYDEVAAGILEVVS